MYKSFSTFQKLSICLRCQHCWRTRRLFRTFHQPSLNPRNLCLYTTQSALKQEISLQQGGNRGDNDYSTSDFIKYEPHEGPVITYEPTGTTTSAQRHARKYSLGLDVLGKPAEILVLQHHEGHHRPDRMHATEPDNDPKESLCLSSSELLEGISKERGIIGLDQVCQNIEELKCSTISHNSDGSGPNGDSAYDTLTSELSSGFTANQLQEYLQRSRREIIVDPMDIRQDYTCRLYSRSSWRQGLTTKDLYSAPNILSPNSGSEASTNGPPNLKKGVTKAELIDQIVGELWQIKPLKQNQLSGEIDIRLKQINFDLILNHRKLFKPSH